MSPCGAQTPYCAAQANPNRRDADPAWPVILYWLLSISQYSFRYILKVNDTHTSGFGYTDTPWYLSGIKYVLTACFIVYCLFCKLRFRRGAPTRLKRLGSICLISFVIGIVILGIKFMILDATTYDISQPWLQTWPYLVIPLLLPACTRPEQALPTLRAFNLATFAVALSFWIATVYLYYTQNRYPALSWPGELRFGGILDDPNGYAALMALLIILTIALRGVLWRFRILTCLVMCAMTRSLAGLGVLSVTFVFWITWAAFLRKGLPVRGALKVLSASAVLVIALLIPSVQDGLATLNAEVNKTLQFKQKSIELHMNDLVSAPELGADTSVADWIIGRAGASENFYSWSIINFGIVGSLCLASCVLAAITVLFSDKSGIGPYVLAWAAGIVVASAGIPYLKDFPINMLFWSVSSIVILGLSKRLSGGGRFLAA